jgi:hypothetical protein
MFPEKAMSSKYAKFILTIFILFLLILITLSFLRSPGTEDVAIWQRWMKNVDNYGLISGFEANQGDYPPFSSFILLCAAKMSRLISVNQFIGIKLSLTVFLIITVIVFWLWTKDHLLSGALYLSLILSSVALGYLDIYFAPGLIVSLWALKEKKLELFVVFYSIACFTKWQPLIFLPFAVLSILNISSIRDWKKIDLTEMVLRILLPFLIIIIFTIFFFRSSLFESFNMALNHTYLSGNALNFNWIMTYLLLSIYPETYGDFFNGHIRYLDITSLKIVLIPKLLFYLFYITAIFLFFKSEKTFKNMIFFSLLGYLSYFIFNTGVHENHLFLAAILAYVLVWIDKEYLYLLLYIVLMANFNLFLFYGISGTGISRHIGFDISLLGAILNVVFFLFIWNKAIFDYKQKQDTKKFI